VWNRLWNVCDLACECVWIRLWMCELDCECLCELDCECVCELDCECVCELDCECQLLWRSNGCVQLPKKTKYIYGDSIIY